MSRQFLPRLSFFLLLFQASLLVTALAGHAEATEKGKKAYIVYMGERLKMEPLAIPEHHKSKLNQVITSNDASERLIYSYGKSFNAFAAMLTEDEAENLSSMDEVVSVFPSQQSELHTTRSWDFMGFPSSTAHADFESDVIVGMLDTGIWPESDSFDDAGFGPPPHKWKGTCQTSNNNFTCNNKIIGARYYDHSGRSISGDNIPSPRDSDGHGTHVSSTAAGRLVTNASLSGLAEGTARGGVPSTRLAVYKVCWKNQGCSYIDMLAGFDDAIAEGVDIISISIGLKSTVKKYFLDPIAIGSFHAVKNGILVSSSAGNRGPDRYSVGNTAPWMLTVAASTIDRKFIAPVKLGNGDVYQGVALNTDGSNGTLYPLIKASNVPNTSAGFDASTAKYCNRGSLDENLTKGRVVICEHFNVGLGPQLSGAVGAIMPPVDTLDDYAMQFKLPVSVLEADDVAKVLRYSNTTSHPMASVEKSEGVFDPHAPYVVSFSSQGPNPTTSNLLKPDLTAPGVDILAAWSPIASQKSTLYNIISGTSMACPHVSGSAAYIKSFNPSWSPAAIKSALMTTAFIMSPKKNPEAEFAYGAGHVNPTRALKPGLVYDADATDYVKFLCGEGYTTEILRKVTGDSSSCTSETNGTIFDLNYPTFALKITKGKPFSATFHRTVTNVGDSNSNYKVNVVAPFGLNITIDPQILSFQSLLEKKSFQVKLEGETNETLLSASLVWSDGMHNVRSPIVVYIA